MAAFVDFEYQDGTSDTAGIASISAGSNADRVGLVAAMLASSVSVSSLAWNGSSILPDLASGAGPGGAWNVYGYGVTGLASGSSAITLSMPPAGAAHCIIAATFDGISSIVSTALVSSGGTPSQPSATVTTVAGDIVVLLGNDLGVYDPTITGTTTGGVTTSVMSGSGFFIGLYCVATGTSTTVGGTFSGSAKNWQGMVFVLRPTGGGGSSIAGTAGFLTNSILTKGRLLA